jgi:hypothetical protein
VKQWTTVHKRAWNLKPGDVISFYDTIKRAEERRTVASVEAVAGNDLVPYIVLRYRRVRWRTLHKRNAIIRVRRRQ